MRFHWSLWFINVFFVACSVKQDQLTLQDKDSTSVQIALGKELFFDKQLSRDNTISCGSCHHPGLALSDSVAKSKGFAGRVFLRNSPSLLNAGEHPYFFADGGAPSLETQALQPIEDEHEMNMPLDQLAYRLAQESRYDRAFRRAFGRGADEYGITHALAAFVRSLRSEGSKYDKFLKENSSNVLTAEEVMGMDLFTGKAKCGTCHSGKWLSDFQFYDVGTGSTEDTGRERITLRVADRYKFKTPILRNLTLTAPYMHDGSITTLDGVVEHFDRRDKLDLTPIEKKQLLAFLRSLTDSVYINLPN